MVEKFLLVVSFIVVVCIHLIANQSYRSTLAAHKTFSLNSWCQKEMRSTYTRSSGAQSTRRNFNFAPPMCTDFEVLQSCVCPVIPLACTPAATQAPSVACLRHDGFLTKFCSLCLNQPHCPTIHIWTLYVSRGSFLFQLVLSSFLFSLRLELTFSVHTQVHTCQDLVAPLTELSFFLRCSYS